jgi:hypothetical protein
MSITWKPLDPETPEGSRFRERITQDKGVSGMPQRNFEEIKPRLAGMEEMLKRPTWSAVDLDLESAKKKRGRRAEWYQLTGDPSRAVDGPSNLETLANYLKRPTQYDLLYRRWSGTTHANIGVDGA